MSDSRELSTLPEVARELKVEYRTLHSWMARGLLSTAKSADGSGHPAMLAPEDVRRARLLVRLRRAGCSMAVLSRAAVLDVPAGGGEVSVDLAPDVRVTVWLP